MFENYALSNGAVALRRGNAPSITIKNKAKESVKKENTERNDIDRRADALHIRVHS
jgi:hypothetical protein